MKRPLLTIPGLLVIISATPVLAVTDTWDGGGADNNISTGNNWLDNTAPLSDLANTDLVFAGTVKPTPNFSAVFNANSLTFNNTAAPFTLGGSALTIGTGGIVNNDVDLQTFSNAVALGTATSVFNTASGPLSFTNSLNIGANTLTVTGGNNTSLPAVTGSGTIAKNGNGSLTFAAAATCNFDLILNAGSISTSSRSLSPIPAPSLSTGAALYSAPPTTSPWTAPRSPGPTLPSSPLAPETS